MATVIITLTQCDICQRDEAAELRFSVGGKDLSIDLCDDCRQTWNASLGPFIAAARPVPRRVNGAVVASAPKSPSYDRVQLVAWADAHGVELPKRGRMPRAILEQYEAWSTKTARKR